MILASEILGFIGIFLNVIIYQQKDRKKLLSFKLLSDFAWLAHYGLALNFSGAAVAGIGVARETTFLSIEGQKIDRRPFLAVFFVCAPLSVWLTWRDASSLLPATAFLLSVVSFWQQRPRLSRRLAIPISLCMLTYDIAVGSIAGIVNEIFTLISTVVGMIRHDMGGQK